MEAAHEIGCHLAAEVAGKFGGVCIRVWGASMVPSIHPGDLVWIERAALADVCVGEIVAFKREGRLTVHRVVANSTSPSKTFRGEEPSLVTRGDRQQENDAPISRTELIGRITHIERGGVRVPARLRLTGLQRTLSPLLRFSGRATSLYLRLAAL